MGAAWNANNQFPWETARYIGGIENVKINITLRIYAAKWHVYAGLAILNPDAQKQIKQYAESVTELFKLMLGGHRKELRDRIMAAREAVFHTSTPNKQEVLLKEDVLNQFTLGELPEKKLRNNHLSLLAMVDCWWKLGIVPYDHMICSTPVCSISQLPNYPSGSLIACSSSVCGLVSLNISSAMTSFSRRPSILLLMIIRFDKTTLNSHSPLGIGVVVSGWVISMDIERSSRLFRSISSHVSRMQPNWVMR
jgi:hypothetical protein